MNHTLTEYNPETESFDSESSFAYGETEAPGMGGSVFNEADETELAAQLLDVRGEHELDRFLGDLVKRAGQAVGTFVRSPTGQALGGVLKDAARQALPIVGGAIGGYAGGERGAQFGSSVASAAGRYFGLELEGLSPEDREFEVAKGFVRLAGEAVKNAAAAPASSPPQAVAKSAVIQAAQRFAPGLLRSVGPSAAATPATRPAMSGRWVRQGRNIVVINS